MFPRLRFGLVFPTCTGVVCQSPSVTIVALLESRKAWLTAVRAVSILARCPTVSFESNASGEPRRARPTLRVVCAPFAT